LSGDSPRVCSKKSVPLLFLFEQHLFVLKKQGKKPQGEIAPAPEKQSLSHLHHGNSTELGPAGQFFTSLDSSGSVGPAGLRPGLSI